VFPAGTYVFRLLDSQSDRHIVQVFNFNKDESYLYWTILAIPNYRLQATDKTVNLSRNEQSENPKPSEFGFIPGENSGQEFVYLKKEGCGTGVDNKSAGPRHTGRSGAEHHCAIKAPTEPPIIA
jgi:hypothetical protein